LAPGTIGNGSLFDYTLHKGLHFATGAATRGGAEALMGGNSSAIHQAALSGGAGAATAEILGEKLALDALRSGRMHTGNVTEMMGHISTLSSQTAGLGAALTGLDVSHAQHAGSVAVENNLLPLVAYAIAAGIAAMKAKDIYDTADGAIAAYQEDGAEGLVDFGVDEGVGMLVAGTAVKGAKVVGKGAKHVIDVAEKILPESVTKAVGKAANSAGGVLRDAGAVLDSAKCKVKSTVKSGLGMRGGKRSSNITNPDVKINPTEKTLLPGEGTVGTYAELGKISKRGDNLARHHIPNDNYMASRGIPKSEGVSIMVESPTPGSGGRHREIHKEMPSQDITLNPRQALAESVKRAREVYKQDNLYSPEINSSLQDVIKQNKERFPNMFNKGK
jgi:hypothetical protein